MPSSALSFLSDAAPSFFYTLSLHDALPISPGSARALGADPAGRRCRDEVGGAGVVVDHDVVGSGADERERIRSEEHTSELQSRQYIVCRLLLEKKKLICKLLLSRLSVSNLV